MPILKRTPVAPPPAPVQAELVNIGSRATYTGGFTLPEGDYAIEFLVRNGNPHSTKPSTRLGVLATFYPLKGGEPQDQFISMGTKAEFSFAPDPETGKGVVAIPGGAGGALNNKTNWFYFLDSLYNSGMPEGVFNNDFTAIDGIHAHVQSVLEPEERKSFGSRTGEAAQEERSGSGMMPVITAILDSGKPWEGTGGIPDATAAPAPVAKVAGTIKPRVLGKPAAAPVAAPVVEAAEGDDAVIQAAVNGAAPILGGLAKGKTISTLQLRTQIFKGVTASEGAEMGQAVQNLLIDNAMLASVLGELGFAVNNGVVGAV